MHNDASTTPKEIRMNLINNTRTLFCATGLLLGALLSACGGGSGGRDAILGVDAAQVASVAVTPATASITVGASQQFVATATYTDGSSRNVSTSAAWSSSLLNHRHRRRLRRDWPAASCGSSSQIGAAFGGKAGSATLTVSALPTLSSIAVTLSHSGHSDRRDPAVCRHRHLLR
ncbi:hypothetical protein LP420_30775 [Massilia sp. B-10]|nr:hypothetical protein LP420_30775 [Massilia sp. B-10]